MEYIEIWNGDYTHDEERVQIAKLFPEFMHKFM